MYSVLNGKPLEQWKVTELKEELKKRKLPVRGLKDELIKRLDFDILSEREQQQETLQNVEENEQEGTVENAKVNESVIETVDNGVNSETQPDGNVGTQPAEGSDGVEGNVEPQVSKDGEVQLINTPEVENDWVVVEEPIQKETDSTVGKIGTPEHQNANVGEAQSVSTPIVDDVREYSGNESKRVEADETMVDVGAVDDSSSVMGQGDVQDVGSVACTDSTAAIMDATDSAAVLMDATDSTAADVVVAVSVETNVTVTQSVVTDVLSSDEELENKEAGREPEVPNHASGDSVHSLSYQNSQVSEVTRDLGFQVRSESISTDCVSIIEKNELKDNLNADNFHIEQNVVMPEMVQPSSNDVSPDDGALRSLDDQEPCEKQNSMQGGLDDTRATANLDKKNDATDASLEKLNLDRSSGDESMEEDISESRQSKHNSDEMKVSDVKEDNHVGVTIDNVSAEGGHAVPVEKRKLQDQEVGKNNEAPKRQRRWNPETLKVPELQTSTLKSCTTHEDAFPSGAPKRSVAKSDLALTPKGAQERVVPPSAKPPTTSLRIDNFLRPFTLKAVQELLAKTGAVCNFWMDHIKTHCYVTYSSVKEATETRNALYNLQWPTNGGKLLVADFVDPEDVKTRAEAPPAAPVSTTPKTPKSAPLSSKPPPEISPRQAVQKKQLQPPPMTSEPPPPNREHVSLPPPPPLPQDEDPPIVTLDDLFRKTTSTPRIYYLPLSEEQVAAKLARQGRNTK
ncbi:apoptotic chromatin condensation inducer in the nucleus-like [Papaver somniferum]|uniref:apoptotic chromatin condensation inducer in the nucleus-like n=1 Tax=Papaver somniferum TaxID=3469 RepID=UPI000E705F8C|nr:apoptotic chromatin condensation inducer in the nucleus-like [Papaver somniferum]